MSRFKRSFLIAGACVTASVVGLSFAASGQDQSAAAPADVILARKTLMSVIARNMYPLDEMIYTGKINLPRGRSNADSIAAMMQAFPLLFPRSSNTWTPGQAGDLAVATFADPHIWDQYDFFLKEAKSATTYAFDASRAENETDFRKSITALRLTCDGCHATFQKNN
jgi:cytochrome c556